ncbi:MAG: hypothetical protein PVI86_07155, partial [Phycisphaerae bacterium]
MAFHAPDEEQLAPPDLEALQRGKLAALLAQVRMTNAFYRTKLDALTFDPSTDPIQRLPFTTRAELQQDQTDFPP